MVRTRRADYARIVRSQVGMQGAGVLTVRLDLVTYRGGFGWSEINATYPGLISVTACRYAGFCGTLTASAATGPAAGSPSASATAPTGSNAPASTVLPSRPGRDQAGQPQPARARGVISSRWAALFPDPACGPLLARAPVVWSSLIFCCPPGVFAMPALGERWAGGRTAAMRGDL